MSFSQALILYYFPFAFHVGYGYPLLYGCYETCTAIKQAKQLKLLWYVGQWSKYQYGQVWQMGYITLPQNHQATCLKWWRQPLDGWKHNP